MKTEDDKKRDALGMPPANQTIKVEEKKDRPLSRDELLELEIGVYNEAMKLEFERKNLRLSLSMCRHCGRLYSTCCICKKAQEAWDKMIEEVKAVSEHNAREEDRIERFAFVKISVTYDRAEADKLYSDEYRRNVEGMRDARISFNQWLGEREKEALAHYATQYD